MLTELKIKNFAIIDELTVSFGSGLNVLTGETGAGKSIIIGAISLLLGDRASADQIRTSADSAEVEALFDITGLEELKEKMEDLGYDLKNDLVIRRTVSRNGRNRIYVDGNLATLNILADISSSLVNICSQHEHQVILNADNHVDILDEFGGLLVQRSEYQTLYAEHQAIKTRLDDLRLRNRKKLEQEEFLRFKLREIREADIKPGEESALQEEKNILSHAQKLMEYASRSYEALYGRTGSILGELKIALQDVREIKRIDSSIALSPEALDSLFFQLEDTALVLRNYLGRITFDPERLSEIDDRLEQIVKLKRKYGGTVDNILKAREETETELSEMASMEEDIARTEQEQLTRKKALIDCADRLTEARRTTAKALKTVVEVEIRALKMADAQFGVDMTQVSDVNSGELQLTAKGADIVEFRLSANKGEVLKPLTRIASGGELSRIILAMKKALAKTGSVSTIIFDEVDSGIGGAVAEVVGEKLKEVSRHHQVICITHLPQIACFGDSHYLVSKSVSADRTNSRVELLSESQRECEIARMLGGRELTQKTAEHAREMLMKRNPEKPAKNDGHKKKIRSKERITKD